MTMFVLVFYNFFLLSCCSGSKKGHGSTSEAFVYSLRNNEDIGPFKSMVNKPSKAIYRYSGYGPLFGDTPADIFIADEADSNSHSQAFFGGCYSVPSGVKSNRTILAGTPNFTPDDWEVFYLA